MPFEYNLERNWVEKERRGVGSREHRGNGGIPERTGPVFERRDLKKTPVSHQYPFPFACPNISNAIEARKQERKGVQ